MQDYLCLEGERTSCTLPSSAFGTNRLSGALCWFAEALKVEGVPGLDVPGIDFVSLAKGYGVEGARAATADDLEQALTAALGSQTPSLIEVATLGEGF